MKKSPAKYPPGFTLIGHSKKAALRATMEATPPKRRRRHFGTVSPLDRLPKKVKGDLRKRCRRGQYFHIIQAWLLSMHRLRISIPAISGWWIRQQEIARKPFVVAVPFEFIVHAPGASEVRVLVKPH